jgi:hypothetical protein
MQTGIGSGKTHVNGDVGSSLSAGPAFDSSGQKPFYVQNSQFGRRMSKPVRCISPCHGRYTCRERHTCHRCPKPFRSVPRVGEFDLMANNVVQLRDFKRREEREADLVRMAKEVMGLIDTAPCEMPPVQPSFVAPAEDPA